MSQMFTPGQTVYLLFWRRQEESEFTRVQIYTTKRRRDNANIDLLAWGLITLNAEWEIPLPFTSALKEVKLTPTCPKCGADMKRLEYGEGDDEWVCLNSCDSTLDAVLKQANEIARQKLGDNEVGV